MFPLSTLLERVVRHGRLDVIDPGGRRHGFGPGGGKAITIRIHDRLTVLKLGFTPGLGFGEAYMNGGLTVENGDILDFLDFALGNIAWRPDDDLHKLGSGTAGPLRRLLQFNWAGRARRNVAHHYDLDDQLYALFLDPDRQYSCGYFPRGDESLEQAQVAKKAHIAAKLLLQPHHHVLDIGCGWGGMALYLHRVSGARVTGITLSERQLHYAQSRARAEGVADRVEFRLIDYRKLDGRYDRIVSVGMFEHVGGPHYPAFFQHCRSLLADDGVMLLHTIGRADGPGTTNRWMRKYIFPGGYSPALSEIVPAVEQAGLWLTDVEVLRLHYAKTLEHWYARTAANAGRIVELYDQRFLRMWLFYLAASLCTFRHLGHVVYQLQLSHHQDAVPLTRDYMVTAERKMTTGA